MSLDKAILHGKEKRKPYRGAKAIDARAETTEVMIGRATTDNSNKKNRNFEQGHE